MTSARTSIRRCGAALLTVLAVVAALLVTSPSASAAVRTVNRTQAAAGWLATQPAGTDNLPAPGGNHFGGTFGGTYFADYGENADVILGLAAAKAGDGAITRALDYLVAHLNDYADLTGVQGGPYDGSVAKDALAAEVADQPGISATNFGGKNLMRRLKDDECTTGSTTCTPGAAKNIFASISESLVITVEARLGGTWSPSTAAQHYLLSLQCATGGFSSGTTACGSGAADLDATSYAIMALEALGTHTSALQRAITWLTARRHPGGYWDSQGGPNVDSTGLAAAALAGHGMDTTASRTWLRTQQVPAGLRGAGALRYRGTFTPTTSDAVTSPSVLGTAQGLLGLASDGSYATLTAAGSTTGVRMFAPAVTVTRVRVHPGGVEHVVAHGFAAGETVTATLRSRPVIVGRARADGAGAVAYTFALPTSLHPGRHTILLSGGASHLTARISITVPAVVHPAAARS